MARTFSGMRAGRVPEASWIKSSYSGAQGNYDELAAMPTIRSGSAYDLKVERDHVQVWLRRDDGAPKIKVLMRLECDWEVVGSFERELSPTCRRLLDR